MQGQNGEENRDRPGLLDTSVIIDLPGVDQTKLPESVGICAITHAELSAGPLATDDPVERAVRQDRLQRVEAMFDPLPFSADAARAYGQVFAAVKATGRHPRGRLADLLIASVALAEGMTLVTRNPKDFKGLEELIDIRVV